MDMGWSKHIEAIEDANTQACIVAATEAGFSAEQANNCDDGELSCPTCPWR